MSLRKSLLPALALLLIPWGALQAQQTPRAKTPAPDASGDFTFLVGGGGFLGIYPEEITRENMGRYNLREARGVGISKVSEGSPAEKAGLKKDDVVLRFNGEEVTSVRKLDRLVSEVAPDHTARLTISRNGGEQELSVTLGQRKDFANAFVFPRDGDAGKLLEGNLNGAPGAFALALGSSRRIGVSTNTLTKQLADYFGIAGGKGVLISSVREDSPAAKAGLKAGDVITEVDGEKIDEVGDLSRSINRKSDGDVTLTIMRDRSQLTIRVTPEKGEAAPLFGPEFRIEGTPRVGQLMTIPGTPLMPQLDKIVMPRIAMPRIQATPRVRALIAPRPL
jgi:serine protease Do